MPFVIPAARDLSGEAWNSFVLRLEQRRALEEERKRREEAADPGGAGLGAGIGAAAGVGLGLLLAPVTMGASLGLAGGIGAAGAGTAVSAGALATGAAIGGVVGGGVGRIAGSLVDPPGSGFPGGQGAQIGAGLQQIAGGVVQGAAARADLLAAEEAKTLKRDVGEQRFLQRTVAALGMDAIKGFDDFKQTQIDAAMAEGRRKPTGPEIQGNFLERQAGRALHLRTQQLQVDHEAKKQVAKESALVDRFNANKASMPKMVENYDLNEFQIPKIKEFQKERVAIPARVREHKIEPEEGDRQLQALGRAERKFALSLQPKPKPMISVDQVLASGGRFDEGRVYSIGDPKTATRGQLYTGRSVNNVVIREGGSDIVESKTDSGLFQRRDADGKFTFESRRLSDGRKMGVGKLHLNPEFPELGPMSFDKDGEVQPFKSKAGGDDTAEVVQSLAIKALGADLPADEAVKSAQTIVEGSRKIVQELQKSEQIQKLKAIHDPKEFVDAIAQMDPTLKRSLDVLREALRMGGQRIALDPLVLREVRDARKAIRKAFEDISQEIDVPPRVLRFMAQMDRVAGRVAGELPRESPEPLIGTQP